MTEEKKEKEDKLIKAIIPKISDYFIDHSVLEKKSLSEFLDFIDLTQWNSENDQEILWEGLCGPNNSKDTGLQKVLVIKNLTDFIHQHSDSLFQPNKSLERSVENYLKAPIQAFYSTEALENDQESIFELYKLLCAKEFNANKSIPYYELEQDLNNYEFINLNKDSMIDVLNSIINEKEKENNKITEIKKENYFELMEKLSKKFKFKLDEYSQKPITFTEEELLDPEYLGFQYDLDYVKILIKLTESLQIINQKQLENYKINDKVKIEYFSKYFDIIINNIIVYIYEIQRVYYEQKQKIDEFKDNLNTRINVFNLEKEELDEKNKKLKEEIEKNSKENLNVLYEEINNIKNDNDKLLNEINSLKSEINEKDKKIINLNDKIENFDNIKEDYEKQTNILKSENETLNKNYTNLLNDFNNKIFKKSDENDFTKKFNLTDEQKNLVTMNHEALISYIIEKDKYNKTIEESNKNLKNKISEFEKIKSKFENDLSELKNENLTLRLKNNNLEEKNENMSKELDEFKKDKNNLLSSLITVEDEPKTSRKINFVEQKQQQIFIKYSYKNNLQVPPPIINFDYLNLKSEEVIISNLEDSYYNNNSNLIFSEEIKYLDEDKKLLDCILFLTDSYFYFFNYENVKCFSISLHFLDIILASFKNNIMSFHFSSGEIIIIEIFRILELINYYKLLIEQKGYKYKISLDDNNNAFTLNKKTDLNFTNLPFYGNTSLSGVIYKRYDGILQKCFQRRFGVICDLGLIIMDDPKGKPLEVINLLFCNHKEFNDYTKNRYIFELKIGKIKHVFYLNSNNARLIWIKEIEKWILNTYNKKIILENK